MPCYHQNVALKTENGMIKKDGTPGNKISRIIFANNKKDFKGYEYYISENKRLKQFYKEYKEKYGEEYQHKQEYIFIPCGKCLYCRQKQAKEWALRIELESKHYQNNYFLTLTYNDENLVIPERTFIESTGEIIENEENWREWKGTLVKEHLIRFINSYRKYLEREYNWSGLRFYACGEYGEKGQRPHYHLILLNNPPLQNEIYKYNKITKTAYRTNKRIEKIWGKGFIDIEPAVWDTMAYVAGYCEKKLFGPIGEEIWATKGQLPVFAHMSRNPGIGRIDFEENQEKYYKNDEIINSKGKSVKPPSYFDRLKDIGEEDVMKEIKEARKEYALNEQMKKMSKTDITIQQYLLNEEQEAIKNNKKHKLLREKNKMYI